MKNNPYIYIFTAALVSYLIRVLPLTLIRKPIKNKFLRSFLFYIPYVTLAVMTFPAIINATQSPIAGIIALIAGPLVTFFEKKIIWGRDDLHKVDYTLFKKYCKTCIPFVLTDGLFGVSTALQTVILGHMSEAAIAANSVSSTLYQVLKVAAVGSASAASVIIGKTIGEGKPLEKIKEYSKSLQVIFVVIGLLMSIILFFIRIPIVSMYNISAEAKDFANGFLLVLCVTCIGTAYQMPTNTGIIRGGGDSKFILIVDIISIWGIVLPLSFAAAFLWNWHPVAVIACLNADQIFKSVPAFIKANRYKWIKKLTH